MSKAINHKSININVNNDANDCQNTSQTNHSFGKVANNCNTNECNSKVINAKKLLNSTRVQSFGHKDTQNEYNSRNTCNNRIDSNVKVNTEESNNSESALQMSDCQTDFPRVNANLKILSVDSNRTANSSSDNISKSFVKLNNNSTNTTDSQSIKSVKEVSANKSGTEVLTGDALPPTMPLVGILKTDNNRHLIKYKQNKCIVFKEGDPLVIGADDEYYSDEWDDEEEEDEESDQSDDEQLYTSDDQELRELTRVNTKFNSNFANFALNKLLEAKEATIIEAIDATDTNDNQSIDNYVTANEDSPVTCGQTIVVNNHISLSTDDKQLIPKVCDKLLEISLNEGFCEVTDKIVVVDSRASIDSSSPDSGNSDVHPMSTSSDCYSSSSGDEKEDIQIRGKR